MGAFAWATTGKSQSQSDRAAQSKKVTLHYHMSWRGDVPLQLLHSMGLRLASSPCRRQARGFLRHICFRVQSAF